MPHVPNRVRALLDGSAGLVCLFAAGWALACMQSGHNTAAAALAVVAAFIPSLGLLLRLWGVVVLALQRPAADKDGAVAAGSE